MVAVIVWAEAAPARTVAARRSAQSARSSGRGIRQRCDGCANVSIASVDASNTSSGATRRLHPILRRLRRASTLFETPPTTPLEAACARSRHSSLCSSRSRFPTSPARSSRHAKVPPPRRPSRASTGSTIRGHDSVYDVHPAGQERVPEPDPRRLLSGSEHSRASATTTISSRRRSPTSRASRSSTARISSTGRRSGT